MYLPQPGKPKYWKALLTTALFAMPLSLFPRAFFHMSDAVWLVSAVAATVVIAAMVHARIANDWRASDTMRLEDFDRRTAVTRNVRIDRR